MIRLTNALGAEKILPLTMSFRRVPLDIEVPSQPLYGRDGDVRTGKTTLRPRQFVLEGSIYYPNKEHIRQELDGILSFLMHPPIEVYRHHTHDRFLRAYALGAPQDWIDGGAELQLRIPMTALDPYWYGPEVEVTVSGTQTIEVGGNAPAIPRIVALGVVDSFYLVNGTNNKSISVNAGGDIEIDNGDYTCKVNGVDRLDLIGEGWFLDGFELAPGENELEANHPIKLTYRPRWY